MVVSRPPIEAANKSEGAKKSAKKSEDPEKSLAVEAIVVTPARVDLSWAGIARIILFACIRLAFAGFLFLTSLYCLLVWVPFSYFGFIRNPLLPWLPTFVRLHGLFYGMLVGALAFTMIPALRRPQTRRAAAGFLLLNAGAFVYLWRVDGLNTLQPDLQSYFWSILSLLPLLWLSVLDLSSGVERSWHKKGQRLGIAQTTFAAVIVSVAFAATSLVRAATSGGEFPAKLALQGFGLSLCFHLAIFVTVGLILSLIGWASGWASSWTCSWATAKTSHDAILCYVLTRAFVWLLLFELLHTMILPTISFGGMPAGIFAATVSLVAVLFAAGFTASLRAAVANERCNEVSSERLSAAPIRLPERTWLWTRVWIWAIAAIAVLAAAYSIPIALGRTDWDFVVQKVAVMVLWLAVLQTICRFEIKRSKAISIAVYGLLIGAGTGFLCCARQALYNPDPSPGWQAVLDNYAGADISFKTAYAVLSRPVDDKAYLQFYEFLKQHTNLPRSVNVAPPDLRLVASLQPTPGIKPNIFVFVIDSLRQDYISPYNPAADYTPQMESFARDSVVLKNAFTRYGGTALSEPAIWTGTMQLHKQYIDPFYPMNNLWKLLETDGYHSYVSVDPLLRMLLQTSPSLTELDRDNKAWGELDFVTTLKELQAKIDARTDRNQPIFAYTQPQNVHTLTLAHSKIKGGRKAISIYELRRIDAAFGEFIAFLQQRGLYDNSIIVLTADHGDCYGEFGRWGHSDFLFPEVIRVPFIFHLPPRLREQFVWNANEVAFPTDITPSLYYLLGHRPIINNELFGKPLFTQTREEALAYVHSQYLLVQSYAPVYAILSNNGQSLFIVDAVNSKNYFYDLAKDPGGSRNHVTIAIQKENETLIRHEVGLIDDLYGWHPSDATQ
jgi:hypothetical protein